MGGHEEPERGRFSGSEIIHTPDLEGQTFNPEVLHARFQPARKELPWLSQAANLPKSPSSITEAEKPCICDIRTRPRLPVCLRSQSPNAHPTWEWCRVGPGAWPPICLGPLFSVSHWGGRSSRARSRLSTWRDLR